MNEHTDLEEVLKNYKYIGDMPAPHLDSERLKLYDCRACDSTIGHPELIKHYVQHIVDPEHFKRISRSMPDQEYNGGE